jgi:hypothetical protein
MDRRHFLRAAGLSFAGLTLHDRLLADPYAPLPRLVTAPRPVRIRGRVTGGGRPLANVRVTDGVQVVRTGSDGRYALVGDASSPFVSVSTPAGWQAPRGATGLPRFFQPIGDAPEQEASFDLVPRPGDARHAVLVLADPQTENRTETELLHAETVPDVQRTVKTLGDRAVLGVACGDIMFDDLSLYPEWERAAQRMGVPFHQVIGNHDLDFTSRTDEGASATFRSRFGPVHHSFDVGAVHYVVLDNVFWHGAGYIGYVDQRQLDWLAADLATVERGATVVVLLHIPPLSTLDMRNTGAKRPTPGSSTMNREALYRLLEPYRAYLVSGHQHELEHVREGGATHVVSGAVCGAWWSGPICYDGTPSGYLVLEADDAAIRWRYQSTGHAPDHQLRGYARGADPSAPDDVVANVWGWDPTWTVRWFEDGEPRGLASRRPGRDPLSVQLHAGADRPARRPWVDPAVTGHLFHLRPSPQAKELVVEATDGWGRTYRERIVP